MPTLKKNPDGTKHIHEYVRVQPKPEHKTVRYRCQHPDCSHFVDRELLRGKRTICSKCHLTETLMDYENLRRAEPVCFKCSNTKRAAAVRGKFEVLDELFGDLV